MNSLMDMIDDVKVKLTDNEYKNIVEKIAEINLKTKEPELYKITYIKNEGELIKPDVEEDETVCLMHQHIKTKIININYCDDRAKEILNKKLEYTTKFFNKEIDFSKRYEYRLISFYFRGNVSNYKHIEVDYDNTDDASNTHYIGDNKVNYDKNNLVFVEKL